MNKLLKLSLMMVVLFLYWEGAYLFFIRPKLLLEEYSDVDLMGWVSFCGCLGIFVSGLLLIIVSEAKWFRVILIVSSLLMVINIIALVVIYLK